MKRWTNTRLRTWRDKPLTSIVDWDCPSADGALPSVEDPTFRQVLVHFLEALPRYTQNGEGRQSLNIGQMRLREKTLQVLAVDPQKAPAEREPACLVLEDEQHKFVANYLGALVSSVFGTDAVAVMDHFEKPEEINPNGDAGRTDSD